MKLWYVHCLDKNAHERNHYRWKALRKAIEAEGGNFRLFNLRHRPDLRVLERGNDTADVAIICDFHSAEILARSRTDITQRAKFRAYITGAGWRREEWIIRGLKGLKVVKPHVVFLSHRVLLDRFKHTNVHHVGLGFDPKVFYPAEGKGSGIVFCGNPAMGRERLLNLMKRKLSARVEWKQGLSHAEMADFLRSGLIGWNQIARGPEFGKSCNLRTWEVLGCRILLLCSWSRDVEFYLQNNRHCAFWYNDEDLIEKARYFLERDDDREYLAEQGYKEALRKHTWDHRALEYLEIIRTFL